MHIIPKPKGRFLVAVLSLIMVATLGACNGEKGEATDTTPTTPSESPAPFSVKSTSPHDGDVDLSTSQKIAVQFTDAVDVSTANTSNIKLEKSDGSAVEGTISVDQDSHIAIFTPSTQLEASTSYTLEVTGDVKSSTQVSLSSSILISFMTGAGGEAPAPNVESTTPTGADINVSTNQDINIQFDQAMDISTLNENTVQLKKQDGTPIEINITFNLETNIMIISPTTSLEANTTYSVDVTSGCASLAQVSLDVDVQISFTTGEIEAPEVEASNPADGSVDIATTQSIEIQFDQAMDVSTINSANIHLTSDTGEAVEATITYDALTNIAIVTPTAELSASTSYHLELTTDVMSEVDISLASTVLITFTTSAAIEDAPAVESSNPVDGSVDVATTQSIEIKFDQAMDVSTVNTANIKLTSDTGVAVEATITYDAETHIALVTPTAELNADSVYHLEVTTDVKSETQVALETSFAVTFTTSVAEDEAPAVESSNPADGSIDVATSQSIEIQFDQAMDVSTINTANIKLTSDTGVAVEATITYDAETHIALVTPTAELNADSVYHLEVTTDVKSETQVALETSFAVTFTTGADTDEPPVVEECNPADGSVDVATTQVIEIQFDQAMDVSTINTTNIHLTKADGTTAEVVITYVAETNIAIVTPTTTLDASTSYNLELTTDVMSETQVALESEVDIDFTTAAQ